jgi:murein DD-endopeptidase MepM/ murein hydrolase activator NlpD
MGFDLTGKHYRFLYIPEDHSTTRELNVSRAVVVLTGLGFVLLVMMAAFYVTGLCTGSSWLPGGSRLQRENMRLTGEVSLLDEKVDVLRDNLDSSYRYQELISAAIGLDPLDPNVREAGIGGRAPLTVPAAPGHERAAVGLDRDLNTLLRQARIQHRGYQAMLDTLEARETSREHLPSIRPVDVGWLSSGYGRRHDPFTGKSSFHRGLDFSVPLGTPVRATADGVVVAMKNESGLGKVVKVDHGNGVTTVYAHLSGWLVKTGQKVRRGDVIARSGSTGRSTAPHLHYEVQVSGRHVSPLPYVLDSYAAR